MAWPKINRKNLLQTLKHCNLSNAINECILEINKGKGSVSAIDSTNTLAVFIRKVKLGDKKLTASMGLGNIEILLKYLTTIKDKSMKAKISDENLMLNRADSKRSMKYMLTANSLISTTIETEKGGSPDKVLKKLLKLPSHSFVVSPYFAKDYLSFVGITKIKTTSINFSDDEIKIVCGSETDHRFTLRTDSDVEELSEEDDYSLNINGEYLARIFGTLEDKPEATAMVGPDSPLIIQQGNTTWVLTPMTEE